MELAPTVRARSAPITGDAQGLGFLAESQPAYRPRHPESTAFYQVLEEHFDRYVEVHEERFEPRDGPLRPVVRPTVEAFLDCGRLENGFARIRCPKCRAEHFLALSCHTRNFCPSCQAKRAALFAEHLREKILEPVSHRHYVFTIPRALRGLFERERKLLGLLARSAYEAVRQTFAAALDRKDAVPGFVGAIQTFGAYGPNFHPHLHAIVSEGSFTKTGEFLPIDSLDLAVLEEVFRRQVLDRLHRAERLSDSFRQSFQNWVHSGFSIFAEQVVRPDAPNDLERLARYATRPPISLNAVEKTADGKVRISTPRDPRTGATEIFLDPLDWVHAITSQKPGPTNAFDALFWGLRLPHPRLTAQEILRSPKRRAVTRRAERARRAARQFLHERE